MNDTIYVTIQLTQDELKQLRAYLLKRDAVISIGFDRAQIADTILARLVMEAQGE